MSNKPLATTPPLSAEPFAPDYAVSDAKEAWVRFDRLVGKILDTPKERTFPTNNSKKEQDKKSCGQVMPE